MKMNMKMKMIKNTMKKGRKTQEYDDDTIVNCDYLNTHGRLGRDGKYLNKALQANKVRRLRCVDQSQTCALPTDRQTKSAIEVHWRI